MNTGEGVVVTLSCPLFFLLTPLAFAAAPRGSSNPLELLPVGADFKAQKQPLRQGCYARLCRFALDAGVVFVLIRNHRRSKLPRGREVGTSRLFFILTFCCSNITRFSFPSIRFYNFFDYPATIQRRYRKPFWTMHPTQRKELDE